MKYHVILLVFYLGFIASVLNMTRAGRDRDWEDAVTLLTSIFIFSCLPLSGRRFGLVWCLLVGRRKGTQEAVQRGQDQAQHRTEYHGQTVQYIKHKGMR